MSKSAQVTAIIEQISGKDATPAPDEALFDSGFLDSLKLANLIDELELKFNITIPEADWTPRKFESVDRIVEYLENHK